MCRLTQNREFEAIKNCRPYQHGWLGVMQEGTEYKMVESGVVFSMTSLTPIVIAFEHRSDSQSNSIFSARLSRIAVPDSYTHIGRYTRMNGNETPLSLSLRLWGPSSCSISKQATGELHEWWRLVQALRYAKPRSSCHTSLFRSIAGKLQIHPNL
ncbi:hypothetical protein BDV35DRAFT_9486 [Aspergillus flavus]|uniref:Uncharacterized protein n=1 Tax=Aspergillus flavus TaxID=5059 RepID=A0A5N6HA05_ASPFL|nr:hypothetical protein BDV35DRAFT_9486 [Aspergillus flavus]